jgi:hypothetical protein
MRRQTTGRVVYPRIHTACPMLIDRGLSRPELRRFASPRQSGPTHSNGRSDFRHRDDTVSASDRSSLSKTPPMHNPHGNRYRSPQPQINMLPSPTVCCQTCCPPTPAQTAQYDRPGRLRASERKGRRSRRSRTCCRDDGGAVVQVLSVPPATNHHRS